MEAPSKLPETPFGVEWGGVGARRPEADIGCDPWAPMGFPMGETPWGTQGSIGLGDPMGGARLCGVRD
jgi:hypothetical protein